LILFVAVSSAGAQGSPNCGKSQIEHSLKIVGGRAAKPHEFPWQVSLQIQPRRNSGWVHVCGGSILTPTKVLTAAHCKLESYPYRAVAGIHDQSNMTNTGVTMANVSRFEDHEKYNKPISLMNDIAVVTLSEALTMTEGVASAICLPEKAKASEPGSMLTVSGWGTTKEAGSTPNVLNTVDVPIITDEKCNEKYKNPMSEMTPILPSGVLAFLQNVLPERFFRDRIPDSMLCAGFDEGGKDSCQGDSGGPAFVFENGTAYQMGVVSWGEGCAREGRPGVYTEVSHYIEWIENKIRN